MRVTGRRGLWTGAVVGTVVLAVSSAAWACTVFQGKMVVTGNAGTGSVRVIGNGAMSWCPGYPMGKAKSNLGGTVTITLSKAGIEGDGCVPRKSRLPAGTYDVNYVNGAAFTRSDKKDKNNDDGSRDWIIDCMSPADPPTLTIGGMTIDDYGKGTGTYSLPPFGQLSGPTDEAAICVSDRLGNYGQQAPVSIV